MGRRRIFSAAFPLGISLLFALPAPASADAGCRDATVACWADRAAAGQLVVVTLDDALGAFGDGVTRLQLSRLHDGRLTVVVPEGTATGAGGTTLLALADERLIARDSTVTPLTDALRQRLDQAEACDTAKAAALCDQLADDGVTGAKLIAARRATEAAAFRAAPGGGGSPLGPILGGVLAVLVLGGLLLIALTRPRHPVPAAGPAPGAPTTPAQPPHPPRRRAGGAARTARPAPQVPSGPRRTATVRTALRPQGYVEIEHGLFRAVWADPGSLAPEPGEPVDVVGHPGRERLTAVPPTS
ncbi:hypothetical protein SRB5_04720 [Streptomyces sp. RB5]|uniref:TPM domain-containing protein n=1 Tax=Streptomyces smaragdinus TaxID=2585196 RepID=A0A7K0CC75_9ACTN|nr:hypothetical protein [Streptomyces smaragdinus]MQY10364.1 hypothetical protein [Streptomyces smaragdinus]